MSAIKRLFGSFYLRVLLVFFITGALLFLTVGGTLRWIVKDSQHPLRPIAINHVKYVVNDIGIPPDIDKAIEITQQMPVRLAIRGPDVDWSSEPNFIPEIDKPEWLTITEPHIVRDRKHRFAIYPKGEYRFYMAWQYRLVKHKDKYKLFVGLGIVVVIFWVSYLATQRVLKPVREVSSAAKKLQQGDLDYRIDSKHSGELGDLCLNVNNMADSLQDFLEAKRQMLLAISHELRSPITRAKVTSEFIDDEKTRKRISSDLDEMESLVGTLIESERLNQPHAVLHKESIDLNTLIYKVVALWNDQPIETIVPEFPSTALVDPVRIELMLRNVLSNAVRHSNGKPIQVILEKEQTQWRLTIADQGDGISEEHIKHLSEPFYRPDDSRQRQTGGFGLGLYLAKRIVEAHKGELMIESGDTAPGTKVIFVWP